MKKTVKHKKKVVKNKPRTIAQQQKYAMRKHNELVEHVVTLRNLVVDLQSLSHDLADRVNVRDEIFRSNTDLVNREIFNIWGTIRNKNEEPKTILSLFPERIRVAFYHAQLKIQKALKRD